MLDEARFEPPDTDPLRLYAIARRDIEMSPLKLAAQMGHAFCDALATAHTTHPELVQAYRDSGRHGVKVCLSAKNIGALMRAYDDATKAGLPCALIIDQHHICPPSFNGEPIITALGIGPARRAQIEHITRRYQAHY